VRLKFLTEVRRRISGDGGPSYYITIPRHQVLYWEEETGNNLEHNLGKRVMVEVEL